MSAGTLQLDDTLQRYLFEHSVREPGPCRQLREQAGEREDFHLISSPEQVQLLALLARLMGARRVLEVGTFVGYLPLWLAHELGDALRVTSIDFNAETSRIARRAWKDAGVDDRIELREEAADHALAELLEQDWVGRFDLAYIDADKEGQVGHYEHCLDLVRPGGLIAVDNTLWKGGVADPSDDAASTVAIREFNDYVYGDDRVDLSLVPIGDGLTLIRRRD